jgi:hypothetical protein
MYLFYFILFIKGSPGYVCSIIIVLQECLEVSKELNSF